MNKINEAIYPHLKNKEDIEKVRYLLHYIDRKISTVKAFIVIYKLLDLYGDIYDIYENVGPHLELLFGTNRCCSFRIVDSEIPKRCERLKVNGFLYCSKHRTPDTGDCCERCYADCNRVVIKHGENWEHYGNIFQKELTVWSKLKSSKSYAIDSIENELLNKPKLTKPALSNSIKSVDKPVITKPTLSNSIKPVDKSKIIKPDISNSIKHVDNSKNTKLAVLNKTKMTDEIESIICSSLILYMMRNNMLKLSNEDYKFYLYNTTIPCISDGKVFKNGDELGVVLDADSVLLEENILDVEDEIDFNIVKKHHIEEYYQKLINL